jgi:hypothetical protein
VMGSPFFLVISDRPNHVSHLLRLLKNYEKLLGSIVTCVTIDGVWVGSLIYRPLNSEFMTAYRRSLSHT